MSSIILCNTLRLVVFSQYRRLQCEGSKSNHSAFNSVVCLKIYVSIPLHHKHSKTCSSLAMCFWQWQAFMAGLLFIHSLFGIKWSIIKCRHVLAECIHTAPAALVGRLRRASQGWSELLDGSCSSCSQGSHCGPGRWLASAECTRSRILPPASAADEEYCWQHGA